MKVPISSLARRCFITVLLCCAFACYAQSVKTLGELSKYTGADRASILVDGAKKEGELTLYYAHPIIQVIADAFSKTYGIK